MGKGSLKLQRLALRAATRLVPRPRYQARVDAILDLDEKNRWFDLRQWEYCKAVSHRGDLVHRYHVHASARAGAPTLLLLHGLNLDGRCFFNLEGLADEYRLIAYNWPDVSARYQGRLDDFVELLDAFVEVLELGPFALAGVSLGGMIAQLYASRRPDLVRALILISTTVPNATENNRLQNQMLDELVRSLQDYQIYWVLEQAEGQFFRKLTPADQAAAATVLQPKRIEFYRQVTAALNGHDGLAVARGLDLPVFYLQGTADELIPLESVDHLREAIPRARVELIQGAGHMMAFLQGELTVRYLREFLRDLG